MIIKDKNLEKYQKKYSWSGIGSRENPIIIEKTPVPHLSFSKMIQYYILQRLELDSLALYSCENIYIKDCKIRWFDLDSCRNIRVERNKINKAQIFYTRESVFVDNILENSLQKQYFSEHLPKLEVKHFHRDIRNVSIFLLINFLISLIIWLALNFLALIIYNFFGISVCTILLILIYVKLRKTRKFGPNEFRNNQSKDLSNEFGIGAK
ncbi:MAG: hypothetical protein MUP85_11970 [Candidatus Lokiarchaeota archaeon]|nr:hypothetical protein [Candidatus Lokiarchaeota archaeon]